MNNNSYKEEITKLLRDCIIAEDVVRKNPWSWKAFQPRPDSLEGIEYNRIQCILNDAELKLWMATDCEYNKDGFRDIIWNWRYWKVMARKYCWYQKIGLTYRASATMKKLQEAESKFVEICGLSDIYKTASQHIEDKFPKLKGK